MSPAFLRRASIVAAACAALAVAACETAPPPPEPAPAPPPPPPAVALNSGVAEAAAVYLAYIRDAATISASFSDAAAVQAAVNRAASYEPTQLANGMVAYAAVLALQSPEFLAGVRQYARDPAQRDELIRQILADPAYAAQLPGADRAAGLVAAQLQADGHAVFRTGEAVKQSAYDVQRERWSREAVPNRAERLEHARTLSGTRLNPSLDESARLLQAGLQGTGLPVVPAQAEPPYTQAVIRALAIAALAGLGAAGEDAVAHTEALMAAGDGAYCLNFSKLNLMQCLAAARPHYEVVFCLGQHILMDTGQCVVESAGAVTIPTLPSVLLAASEPVAPEAAGAVADAVESGATAQPN